MAQFHTLTVTDIHKTIRDAAVLTLQADDVAAFAFVPGQYLTFKRVFDGEEIRRSYSICTAVHDNQIKVGVKRVDGGVFSTWVNTELAVGDRLDAMSPMGKFYSGDALTDDTHILGFAGGSGITPVLSIIRTVLAESDSARFTLVYANRNVNTIMFRDELEDLKNRFMQRLNIIHILEDESQDIDLFTGRIDAEKCSALFKHWIDIKSVTCSYICGPEPMMQVIAAALEEYGIDKSKIRFELFASNQPGRAKKPAASRNDNDTGLQAQVTLNGETRSFTMKRDTSLLEAGLANTLDAPFACKAGVCSTCKAKVLEGETEMLVNHALEDYEVEAGYVLTCQCYPLSDKVVWDYDQAGH